MINWNFYMIINKLKINILVIGILMTFIQHFYAYADKCTYIINQTERMKSPYRLNQLSLDLNEGYFKKKDTSKACFFYIGKRLYELSGGDINILKKAEMNFEKALKEIEGGDKLFVSTYKYLLVIEKQKKVPDIQKIETYLKKIKNYLPNRYIEKFQNIIKSQITKETLKEKIKKIDEEKCWQLFKNYQYHDSKVCFQTRINQLSNNRNIEQTEKRIEYLESLEKEITKIEDTFFLSCEKSTSDKNISNIDSWFRYNGKFGQQNYYYPITSLPDQHRKYFIAKNFFEYGSCTMDDNYRDNRQYVSAYKILKEAQKYEKYLWDLHQLFLVAKDYCLKKYKSDALDSFFNFHYDDAINQFNQYHSISEDKKFRKTIKLISQIKHKENQIFESYDKQCNYNVLKKNFDNIINWFGVGGKLSSRYNDYPKKNSASRHARYFNSLNLSSYAQCRDNDELYISLTDILKNAKKYYNYLNERQQKELNDTIYDAENKESKILNYLESLK